jgi:hypothetical protein
VRISDALASVAGRISTGTAMAVAILVGLWPDHARQIDPVRLGAVITTVVAWLAAEIASGRKPSEHDVTLFKSIVEVLPSGTVDFLRNHDFHNSYGANQQDGLFELAAWEGSRRQFLDKSLHKRWNALLLSIKSFSAQLAGGTGPVGAGPMFSAHPDHGDKDNPEPWVAERIDKLNSAASKLSNDIDAFETFARSRLRL